MSLGPPRPQEKAASVVEGAGVTKPDADALMEITALKGLARDSKSTAAFALVEGRGKESAALSTPASGPCAHGVGAGGTVAMLLQLGSQPPFEKL